MSVVRALDHVVVGVRDLATASATFGSLLGRAPSWCGVHPGLGTANALFRLENLYLELLAPAGEGGPAGEGALGAALRRRLESRGEGPLALALATDDAERCARVLRERGLAVEGPTAGEGRESGSGALRRWRRVTLPLAASRGVPVFAIEHLSPPDALPPAKPVAEPGAAVSAVDHVVIRSEAPEAAIAFYGEQLGIRLALDRTFEAWGVRLLFFRLAGVTIEVAAPATPAAEPAGKDLEPAGAAAEPAGEDRLWGISWRVPDVAAARERLAAAGFDVSEVRPGRRPSTRVCTVRGPTHGVATLLLEAPERGGPPAAQAAHQ